MADDWYSQQYERDPKTGQYHAKGARRNLGWQSAQGGKATGDFKDFDDYGAPSSASEMGGAMDTGTPAKSYGVDEGDQ